MRLDENGKPGLAGRLLDGMRGLRDSARRIRKLAELRRRTRVRPLRIVTGSGGVPVEGWILSNIDQPDILVEKHRSTYFTSGSIDSMRGTAMAIKPKLRSSSMRSEMDERRTAAAPSIAVACALHDLPIERASAWNRSR